MKRRAEAEREPGVGREGVLDRRRQVGSLGVEELEELELATGLQVGACLFGQGEEAVAMAGAQRLLLAGLGEPLEPILAHGFEQAVAGPGVALLGEHQRLVDQRAEQLEHLLALDPVAGADLLGSLERKAAGEDREAAKQGPLGIREQLMAPVDRGAQGLKPGAGRARAAGEQAKAIG